MVTHLDETQNATITNGSTSQTTRLVTAADISGSSFSIHIDGSTGVTTLDFDVVVVGRAGFVRQNGQGWSSVPELAVISAVHELQVGLRPITDPSQVRYVGPETVDGRRLHRLTATMPIEVSRSVGGTTVTTTYDEFDAWVDEDGYPVLFRSRFSGSDGSGNEVTGVAEDRFSGFGVPIRIVAPIDPSHPNGVVRDRTT